MKRTREIEINPIARLPLLLLLCLAFVACGSKGTSAVKHGQFAGRWLTVLNRIGNIDAYAPEFGQPPSEYTVIQTTDAKDVLLDVGVVSATRTLLVCSTRYHYRQRNSARCLEPQRNPVNYVIRVPRGVRAYLFTMSGSIRATDVPAPVEAVAGKGDIKIQVPTYADAATRDGNITAMFGDARWPGTLHFTTEHGDIEVWVPATAAANVYLHTDRGTIFTDFDLRGTSNHGSETIVGPIGRGGTRRIDVRVTTGSIRLLKLTPQM